MTSTKLIQTPFEIGDSQRRMSHKQMAILGWVRLDPKPWEKVFAEWRHKDGWTLRHCGHPTALFPWILRQPDGRMILMGAIWGEPEEGYAWRNLYIATRWVAAQCAPAA